jgi:hypothetical protein
MAWVSKKYIIHTKLLVSSQAFLSRNAYLPARLLVGGAVNLGEYSIDVLAAQSLGTLPKGIRHAAK